jgi:lysozyme family protein
MTISALATALIFTLKEEGGYVDNPHDHGGATNHGVTQATYDAWRDSQKKKHRSVTKITDAEVQAIYGERYWTPGQCGVMSPALSVCHFDWCVNHGVTGAIETLQQALKVTVDGDLGPKSLAALKAQDMGTFWKDYNGLRRSWYEARVKAHPDQGVFLKGWLARVDRLDSYVGGLK